MFCLFCSFWSMNLGCSVSVIIWFHILSEIHNSSLNPGAVFSFKVKSIWHSVPCLVALATLTYSYDFINFYVDLHCKHFFIQTFFSSWEYTHQISLSWPSVPHYFRLSLYILNAQVSVLPIDTTKYLSMYFLG